MWTRPPGNSQAVQSNGNVDPVPMTDPNFYTPNQSGLHRPDFDAELQLYMGSKQHRDLLERMKGSMKSRFNAHNRLEQKHKVSIFTLSIISLFVVAISLYALTYSPILHLSTKSAITFASIISSIFIIIVGLLESQNNYQVRALQMHKCAMEINDLYQRLQIEPMISKDTLQYYTERFHSVMQGCPYNYDDIDYLMAKVDSKKEEDVSWDMRLHVNLTYWINVYGLNLVIMIIPPLILFLL
ncbi:MAG: SLATT domain-containing protein [Methyloligellaceae bacterium]